MSKLLKSWEERLRLAAGFLAGFSSGFHKEVTSSTVSAQGNNDFQLPGKTICHRVGSADVGFSELA